MRQAHLHAALAGGAQVISQLLHSDIRPPPPAAVDSAEGAATDLGAHLHLCLRKRCVGVGRGRQAPGRWRSEAKRLTGSRETKRAPGSTAQGPTRAKGPGQEQETHAPRPRPSRIARAPPLPRSHRLSHHLSRCRHPPRPSPPADPRHAQPPAHLPPPPQPWPAAARQVSAASRPPSARSRTSPCPR